MTPLERAWSVADDVLAPSAEQVDIDGVIPATHFEALADAGLFGLLGPTSAGGLDVTPHEMRRITGTIAGGCGSTFFCWVQHHGVLRAVRSSPNDTLRRDLLPGLCAGTEMAGVAFAHARRQGPPAVRATPVAGGWQINGVAPWTTSWGIARHFVIVAETPDRELVWALFDAQTDGVDARLLELGVFASTGTVALEFSGLIAADAAIIDVIDADEWRRTDRAITALGQTAVLGVAERAIGHLRPFIERDDEASSAAAASLATRVDGLWADDAALLSDVLELFGGNGDADSVIERAAAHRARCLDAGHRATTALIAAHGGAGISLSNPAQRLARESLFYVIQAQTADGRAATLNQAAR